ncbi:MAG: hypothetical protein CBC48_17405 [bacterium TMED88]|nr:hypothetical protein [Deltaproteobacteria bacterium]OUV24635.1 MAG: hypothetical protein CBC48_17405 [bacterium TMED88]
MDAGLQDVSRPRWANSRGPRLPSQVASLRRGQPTRLRICRNYWPHQGVSILLRWALSQIWRQTRRNRAGWSAEAVGLCGRHVLEGGDEFFGRFGALRDFRSGGVGPAI